MAASRPVWVRPHVAGLLFFVLFLPACGLVSLPGTGPLPDPEADSLARFQALAPQALNRADLPPLYLLAGRLAALPTPLATPEPTALPEPFPGPLADPARLAPVVPPQLAQATGGQRHLCGFDLTPALAQGLRALAAGDPEQMLLSLAASDQDPDNPKALTWTASILRARAELLRGRPDLAEDEAMRAEGLETALTGSNLLARAVRAEARFLAGDLKRALADALSVTQALGTWTLSASASPHSTDDPRLGAALLAQIQAASTIGGALYSQGRTAEALPWLDLTDRLHNLLFSLGTRADTWQGFPLTPDLMADRGLSLACLGSALTALSREPDRATALFARAEHFYHAAGIVAGPVYVGMFRARGLLLAGRGAEAETVALAARTQAETWDMMDAIWRLDTLRGLALTKDGLDSEASEALRRAQRLADRLAGAKALSPAIARLGLNSRTLALALSRLDEGRDDWDFLFQDAERARARAVADQLTQRKVGVGRQTEVVERLRLMDREIIVERQRKGGAAGAAGGRERDLLYEREALLTALRGLDPELADLLGVHTLDLDEVKARLPLDTTLVYVLPVEPSEPVRALFITDDFLQLRQLPCDGAGLTERLAQFAALRRDRNQAPRQREVLNGLKADLGLDTWGRTSALFVVPSGDFRLIPWGALDLPYPVAVLPSGGWLARSPLSLGPDPRTTVLADPDFGGLAPQLPGARTEATALAQAVGARVLTGSQATEAALRDLPPSGAEVVHLATWTLPDPVHPLRTALLLSHAGRAAPLSAERLLEYPLPARLAVLTGGQTGAGLAGTGLAGSAQGQAALERGFFLGGAMAVVSSLWPVEDQATAFFTSAFQAALRGSTPGQAWLKARDLTREAGYAPAEYGAFVLAGSPGRVIPDDYVTGQKSRLTGPSKSRPGAYTNAKPKVPAQEAKPQPKAKSKTKAKSKKKGKAKPATP